MKVKNSGAKGWTAKAAPVNKQANGAAASSAGAPKKPQKHEGDAAGIAAADNQQNGNKKSKATLAAPEQQQPSAEKGTQHTHEASVGQQQVSKRGATRQAAAGPGHNPSSKVAPLLPAQPAAVADAKAASRNVRVQKKAQGGAGQPSKQARVQQGAAAQPQVAAAPSGKGAKRKASTLGSAAATDGAAAAAGPSTRRRKPPTAAQPISSPKSPRPARAAAAKKAQAASTSPVLAAVDKLDGTPGAQRPRKRAKPGSVPAEPQSGQQLSMGAITKSSRQKRKRDESTVTWKVDRARTDVKFGPFSASETEAVRAAITQYAKAHNLDDQDLSWLFDKAKHRGAASAIAEQACPDRRKTAVLSWIKRHLNPARQQKSKWTSEERQRLFDLVASHGTSWTKVAAELGRTPEECRDWWRHWGGHNRDKVVTGSWSAEEENQLKDLVKQQEDMKAALTAAEEEARLLAELEAARDEAMELSPKKATSRQLTGFQWVRDRIDWDWVASAMKTRTANQCRIKWYNSLCPSMIERGDWGPGDDRRMLKALHAGGYQQEWQVPWSDLVEGRRPEAIKRRWFLMLKEVPGRSEMNLAQQVQLLVDVWLKGKTLDQAREEGQGAGAAATPERPSKRAKTDGGEQQEQRVRQQQKGKQGAAAGPSRGAAAKQQEPATGTGGAKPVGPAAAAATGSTAKPADTAAPIPTQPPAGTSKAAQQPAHSKRTASATASAAAPASAGQLASVKPGVGQQQEQHTVSLHAVGKAASPTASDSSDTDSSTSSGSSSANTSSSSSSDSSSSEASSSSSSSDEEDEQVQQVNSQAQAVARVERATPAAQPAQPAQAEAAGPDDASSDDSSSSSSEDDVPLSAKLPGRVTPVAGAHPPAAEPAAQPVAARHSAGRRPTPGPAAGPTEPGGDSSSDDDSDDNDSSSSGSSGGSPSDGSSGDDSGSSSGSDAAHHQSAASHGRPSSTQAAVRSSVSHPHAGGGPVTAADSGTSSDSSSDDNDSSGSSGSESGSSGSESGSSGSESSSDEDSSDSD